MNYTKLIAAFALLAVMTMAISCGGGSSSVDAALSQMEKAMDKVEENKTSMTEADWKALAAELEQPAKILEEAVESNSLGAMARLRITAAMMRYVAILSEAALHTVTDSLNVHMEEFNEKMEEMNLSDSLSIVGDQLKEALNSEELKNAVQELQNAQRKL